MKKITYIIDNSHYLIANSYSWELPNNSYSSTEKSKSKILKKEFIGTVYQNSKPLVLQANKVFISNYQLTA